MKDHIILYLPTIEKHACRFIRYERNLTDLYISLRLVRKSIYRSLTTHKFTVSLLRKEREKFFILQEKKTRKRAKKERTKCMRMIYSRSKYSHTLRTFFFQSRKIQARCVLMCLQRTSKRKEQNDDNNNKQNEISYTQNI